MNCEICGKPLDGIHILDGCPPQTRDEIIEQAAQVVHVAIAPRWMTVCSALSEDRDYPELLRNIARALADAGLLARPMDKISLDRLQELAEARGYNRGFHLGWDAALDFTKGKNQ